MSDAAAEPWTTRRTRRWLWLGALAMCPLPYLLAAEGYVPVVRMLLLACVSAAYAGLVDGSGLAWTMVALLLAHVVAGAAVLWLAAAIVARVLPPPARQRTVAIVLVLGFAVANAIYLYRTPFDDAALHARWFELFQ